MLKPLAHFSVGFIILIIATVITTTLAQPLLPVPAPLHPRTTTELLTNNGFELDVNNDKLPDGWTGKNTTLPRRDKLQCDKPEQGKFFAHTGSCAFMFKGNPDGKTSKLQYMTTDFTPFVAGTQVNFSVYIDSRSGIVGSKFAQVTISYTNDTSEKLVLTIPGTAGYIQVSQSAILSAVPVKSVKLDFRYKGKSGKFLIDDASFAILDDIATPSPTNTPVPSVQLLAGDGSASDEFGVSVAIDSDTVAVGAAGDTIEGNLDQGSAYVFTRSGTVWTQQQKLTATDGTEGDEFGRDVAIDGDTAVVGAPGSEVTYVFTRSGTVWTLQQKLTATDGTEGDRFGDEVAIDGDTVVVGAPLDGDYDSGSVYVFTRSGTVWTPQQKLNGVGARTFGQSVAIAGDTVVVGGDGFNYDPGSAHVFTRSGTVWTLQQKLTGTYDPWGDNFGVSVAITGDTVVVGALDPTPLLNGWAYVFTRSDTVWTLQQQLARQYAHWFGASVAIASDTVVVGASVDFEAWPAFVFTRSGILWTEQQMLTAGDATVNSYFGVSVAIADDTVVVGASLNDIGENTNQGSVYVFDLVP